MAGAPRAPRRASARRRRRPPPERDRARSRAFPRLRGSSGRARRRRRAALGRDPPLGRVRVTQESADRRAVKPSCRTRCLTSSASPPAAWSRRRGRRASARRRVRTRRRERRSSTQRRATVGDRDANAREKPPSTVLAEAFSRADLGLLSRADPSAGTAREQHGPAWLGRPAVPCDHPTFTGAGAPPACRSEVRGRFGAPRSAPDPGLRGSGGVGLAPPRRRLHL